MKITIVRGAFLNPFELQNYTPLKNEFNVIAISSKFPISTKIDLPLTRLWSPTDLPPFPFKYPILNRLFVDAHRLFGLENVIKRSDVVHVAETYYGYTNQAVIAKRRGLVKKIVSTVWEVIPHNNEKIRGRKNYKKLARENIDHFIAVTNLAKTALIKEGVKSDKISVIPVGINLDKFKPSSTKKNKRDITVLCVARLVPEKGVMDLLHAFLNIRKKIPNLRLVFVGSGPLKSELKGYKNVSVKTVPYSQIQQEYLKSDIFCLPSRATETWEEQYGMCLVEAMACGIPVISTKTGAIPEVCGDSALLFDSGNVAELEKLLTKLIYNKELRLSLGKRGSEIAKDKYDSKKIAAQISDLYKKICR